MIASDSYMGMFFPEDIDSRILYFLNKKTDLPFVESDELMGCFYLFGKDNRVRTDFDIMMVKNLAKKTISQVSNSIRAFAYQGLEKNQELIRQNLIKRSMQIAIDTKDMITSGAIRLDRRISRDPTILSDIFAMHIAYFKKNYFFYLFDPLPKISLPLDLSNILESRMLMLSFNVKDVSKVPYSSILTPFLDWFRRTRMQ
jgi:hypothetical protein